MGLYMVKFNLGYFIFSISKSPSFSLHVALAVLKLTL